MNARRLEGFLADDAGATAVEYGVIAVVVLLALSYGADKFGKSVENSFGSIEAKIETSPKKDAPQSDLSNNGSSEAQAIPADKRKSAAQDPAKWELRN